MPARVPFEPPLDIAASLETFRRSGDDLIDRWDGRRLIRAASIDGQVVAFAAVADGSLTEPSMQVTASDERHSTIATAAAGSSFVPAGTDYATLLEDDPVLRMLDARFPGVRQVRQLDLFTALIRAISAQQVNLRWAVTTRRRLAERFGILHEVAGESVYSLDAMRTANASVEEVRALQFTTSKSRSIVAVARALADGYATLEELQTMADDEVVARLVALPGIGRWSAEWVLARTLGRPTVVAGDLGVRKAVGLAYLDQPLPSEEQVRQATAHWGPAAATAQALLLHALAEGALSDLSAPPPSRVRPEPGTAEG